MWAMRARLGEPTQRAVARGDGSNVVQRWIYDTLKPFAAELPMGHPAMMKAIGASKK